MKKCLICDSRLRGTQVKYCSRACYSVGRIEPIEIRFWAKVDRRGPGECWPWLGGVFGSGYGYFRRDGRSIHASRVSLEIHLGHKLGEKLALHKCDNPICVNPNHLWAGTQKDNMQDMSAKGRSPKQRILVCKHGHSFSEANTYRLRGHRYCRRCNAIAQQRRKQRIAMGRVTA